MKLFKRWVLSFTLLIGSYNAWSQSPLAGSWKLLSVRMTDKNNQPVVFNLKNRDSLAVLLTQLFENDNIGQDEKRTDKEIKREVGLMMKRYYQVKIDFLPSSQFLMISNGILFPEAVPGWHFGKTMQGTWSAVDSSNLSFKMVGNPKFSLDFKILTMETDILVIAQNLEGETRTQEFTF